MKEKIFKNKDVIRIAVLVFIGILIGIPIFSSKLDVYFDDGIQHISRAYGTLESLKENFLFPNVIFSFANNFGYSWNLFYGPLSTYGVILISLICKNFIVSYKFFTLICLILSGYFMYKFVYNVTQNKNVAFLASVLYMSFPYHLTDWYTRNALGEFVSFVFIPLVFLGLYNLLYTTEKHYYLTIGAVGLILTHNLSTVIVAFFSLLYVGINATKLKETNVKRGLIINIIFILTLSAFFIVPLIETKFFSNYQVYEDGMMATPESTAQHGLKINQLFVTLNDGSYVFELGPHIIIMLAFSIMAFKRIDPKIKEQYGFFLLCGLLTLWMSTRYFPWRFLPKQISIIQFPWRMLMMSAFFLSIVCAMNMQIVIKKFNYKDVAIISIISILYIISFSNILVKYSNNIQDIVKFDLGHISGSEYEITIGTAKSEYLPVNAYKNRFYIASRNDKINILEGNAVIENEFKSGGKYNAKIKTSNSDYTVFELPYIYYPGYEARLDGMMVDTFETSNGFLGFVMYKDDSATLEVKYVGTDAMKISMLISFISLITFSVYVWKKR